MRDERRSRSVLLRGILGVESGTIAMVTTQKNGVIRITRKKDENRSKKK